MVEIEKQTLYEKIFSNKISIFDGFMDCFPDFICPRVTQQPRQKRTFGSTKCVFQRDRLKLPPWLKIHFSYKQAGRMQFGRANNQYQFYASRKKE